MSYRDSITRLLGLTIGAVVALCFAELLLRLVPTQDGIFAADHEAAWPVTHLSASTPITWSSGWHFENVVRGRTNARGYVSPFEYSTGARITAVLGDSYIESLMNPYESTLQGQLPRFIGTSTTVFNFGVSGSALPDYLGLASLLRRDFKIEQLVVLVGQGDFVEGFEPSPGHFGWSVAQPGHVTLRPNVIRSRLSKTVRSLALVRYVRGNLKLTLPALFKSRPSHAVARCTAESLQPGDREILDRFVSGLPEAYGLQPDRVVLLLDRESGRKALYGSGPPAGGSGTPCPTRDALALEYALSSARIAGIHVVDTLPLFRAHYLGTGERVDHSPLDWHWNAVGHRLAAEAAGRQLRQAP